MSPSPTRIDDHDPLANAILHVLEDFIDEIAHRECTGHFDKVVDGKFYLKGKHLTQKPERFIEDHLVFPILTDALGHEVRPQPKQYAPRWPKGGGIPDFCVTSLPIDVAMQNDVRVFGEVKPPKKLSRAHEDIKDYLDSDLNIHAVAILTDGFDWELWIRPQNRSLEELDNPCTEVSLRDPLKTVRARNHQVEPYRPHQVRNRIDTDRFAAFTPANIQDILQTELGLDVELAQT